MLKEMLDILKRKKRTRIEKDSLRSETVSEFTNRLNNRLNKNTSTSMFEDRDTYLIADIKDRSENYSEFIKQLQDAGFSEFKIGYILQGVQIYNNDMRDSVKDMFVKMGYINPEYDLTDEDIKMFIKEHQKG